MAARQQPRGTGLGVQYEDFVPKSEWKDQPEATLLTIDLPGFTKEQIKVTFVQTSKMLRVTGERPLAGRRWSRFNEVFTVPQNCLVNKLHGSFNNSTLTITMPKETITKVPNLPETSKTVEEKRMLEESRRKAKEEEAEKKKKLLEEKEGILRKLQEQAKENEMIEARRLKAEAKAKERAEARRLQEETKAKESAEARRLQEEAKAKERAEARRLQEAKSKEIAEARRLQEAAIAKERAEAKRLQEEAVAKQMAEARRLQEEAKAREMAEARRLQEAAIAKEKAEARRLQEAAIAKERAEARRLQEEAIAKERAQARKLQEEAIAKEKLLEEAALEKKYVDESVRKEKMLMPEDMKLPELDYTKSGTGSSTTKPVSVKSAEEKLSYLLVKDKKTGKGMMEKIRGREITSEEKKLMVNVGVSALVIFALGAYISYSFCSSSSSTKPE